MSINICARLEVISLMDYGKRRAWRPLLSKQVPDEKPSGQAREIALHVARNRSSAEAQFLATQLGPRRTGEGTTTYWELVPEYQQ